MAIPPKAPLPAQMIAANWGGFYVGGHGAYGWGKFSRPDPDGLGIVRDSVKGGFGGVQAGFNWQTGAWAVAPRGAPDHGRHHDPEYA